MGDNLDFCVFITTYNRPTLLYNLLEQIESSKSKFNIKIFVFDDCSFEKVDISKFDVRYVKFFPNYGKKNFWKIINVIFKVIKNINSKYFVFLQDDFELCDNFFNELKIKYENLKDDKKISLEFLTDNRTKRSNWNTFEPQIIGDYIHTNWVELHFICEKKFFDVLDYKINEIPKNRWDSNPNLSSGVGQQLTQRLNNLGLNMYHTKETLVNHSDNVSMMNFEERKINNLITK
jgi:hypothetical protein